MTTDTSSGRQVSFTRMDRSTPEDITLIVAESKLHLNDPLPDTMIAMLEALRGPTMGYQVDRYEHSLQAATRALREGAETDLVIAALLHDVGDAIAPANHAELAAAIVRPYLSAEATWVVKYHGVFQGYHYWDRLGLDTDARERYRDSPFFDTCAHFCAEWDQVSFDPEYDTLPIETFVPMLREVFTRPASGFGAD